MTKGAIGLAVILLVALLAGITAANWSDIQQSKALTQDGIVLFPQPLPVRDFRFTNQLGAGITKADLQGKNLLIFFGYTYCPDICPTTLMDLSRTWKQLPELLKQQWQVVLVSIDPQRDTPEVMAPYMAYFNKDFIALTGHPEDLSVLAAELNAVYLKVERGEGQAYLMDHSANLAIVDKRGRYLGYIEPPHNAARMVPLIKALSR